MGFPVSEIAPRKIAYIQEQIRLGVPDFVKAGISIDKLLGETSSQIHGVAYFEIRCLREVAAGRD